MTTTVHGKQRVKALTIQVESLISAKYFSHDYPVLLNIIRDTDSVLSLKEHGIVFLTLVQFCLTRPSTTFLINQ